MLKNSKRGICWSIFTISTILLLTGCDFFGGSDSAGDQAAVVTAPLTQLSPFQAKAGEAGFTLQLRGKNFTTDTTALWNGVPKDTNFISSELLEATITAGDIVSQDVVQVRVRYAETTQSNHLPFFIKTSVPKFLYTSSTSGNIYAFSVDELSGYLTELPGSPFAFTSGDFGLVDGAHGKHLYLLDYTTNSVHRVSIDRTTGVLIKSDMAPISEVDWIMKDPAGEFLFTSRGVYTIDKITGNLSDLPSSPYGADMSSAEALQRFWDASARFMYYATGERYGVAEYTLHRYWFNRETIELEYIGSNGFHEYMNPKGGIGDPTGRRILTLAHRTLDYGRFMSFNIDPLTGEPTRNEGEFDIFAPITITMGGGRITLHPSGRFAYLSYLEISPSSIATINIELESGAISEGLYYHPEDFLGERWDVIRPFIVSPSGRHLYIQSMYNQTSFYIESLAIDSLTGTLNTSAAESFQLGERVSQAVIAQ